MLVRNVGFAGGENRYNIVPKREMEVLKGWPITGISERGSHRPARKLASRGSTRPSGRVRIETAIATAGPIRMVVAPGLRVG